MMSHRALSELHIIPQKQSVNAAYYRDDILGVTCYRLDELGEVNSLESLIQTLKFAWSGTDSDILNNLRLYWQI